jgi:hypothetical protein
MQKAIQHLFFVILLALTFVACSKKTAPNPTQTAVPSNPNPASPAVAVPTSAQPQAPSAPGFEGDWKGDSGKDLPISFSVQNNQVSSLNASYAGHKESCSFNGNFSSDSPSPINGKTFTAHGKKDQIEFNLNGTFTSATEASGTLVWKGKTDICGDFDLQYKWTAKKGAEESPGDD